MAGRICPLTMATGNPSGCVTSCRLYAGNDDCLLRLKLIADINSSQALQKIEKQQK